MKKLFLLTLYCCCTFYAGLAQEQPFTLNQGQSSVASYHEVLPVDVVGQKMVVPVTINGKSRRFILDTGAPVILSSALVAELKPKVLKTILVKDAFGKQDSMNVVAVDKLIIGNTGFEQIPALIAPASDKLMECMHVDGIIGSNLLRHSIVQIDLQQKTITLSSDDARFSFGKADGLPLFKTPIQSNPYIKLQLASRTTLEVLFDSGDNDFLSISNRHYEFIRKENKKALKVLAAGFGSSSYGLHGKEQNTQKLRLQAGQVNVGEVSFTNVITETMDDPDSRIGMKLMEYGVVTLDYKNERFYFKAYNDLKSIALDEKKWQVQPNLEQDKIIVGIAWGPIAEKVKYGEEIVAVDGKPTAPVDMCRLFREKILPADKTAVVLTVKGADGAERMVNVIKE
jgi:hypothetical protein